jgi:hypothetical protein
VSEDGPVTDTAAPPGEYSYFPPDGLQVAPWEPEPRAPWWPVALAYAKVSGVTTALVVLLGAPLALLWRALTPVVGIRQTAGGPQPVAPESNQVFAVDGWFVVVSILAGLAVGVVAWLALRERGPAAPFGLALGGLAAALVATRVGERLVVDRYLYDFCHRPDVDCLVYTGTLRLNATAAVVVLPVAILTAFVALTYFFDREPHR